MILCLDLRNDTLAYGFHDGEKWLVRSRIGFDPARSPGELALLLRLAFMTSGIPTSPERAVISSVVPARTGKLVSACAEAFGVASRGGSFQGGAENGGAFRSLVVGPGVKTGLKIRSDNPSELGSDLVCLCVAARARIPGNLVVVDSGAALTLSALNDKGEFLGAAIAPGMETGAWALHARAAQLPECGLEEPPRAIGRTTAQSLSSGIRLGYRGLLDHLLALFAKEMGKAISFIGTGDTEKPLLEPSTGYAHYDSWLALEGLRIIAEMNPQPSA